MAADKLSRSLTHAEIVVVIGAGTLRKGELITISDFETKEIAHGSLLTADLITGAPELLLLRAISNNAFAKEAYSLSFPNDYIEYDIADVLCEDGVTARKGRIIRRKDINGNSTPWDFRAVKHICKSIIAPNYSASVSYPAGILVTYNGWLYKSTCVTTIGTNPETHLDWIKYLPAGSLMNAIDIDNYPAHNMGNIINTNLTYSEPEYLYTFTNEAREECSALFKGFKFGDGSKNIVCFAEAGKTLDGLTIGRNAYGLRFTGIFDGQVIGDNAYKSCIYLKGLNGSFGSGFRFNVIGIIEKSVGQNMIVSNIFHNIANGVLLKSETVYNNIESIANSTTETDFWDNRYKEVVYCQFGPRFSSTRGKSITSYVSMALMYQCMLDTDTVNVTMLSNVNACLFPSMQNLIMEMTSEIGYDFTPFISLLNTTDSKKIIGDDNIGFFLVTRGAGGIEVITPLV